MPRYFFHLRNDHHLEDEEGSPLPNDAAARAQAKAFALSMAAASIIETHKLDLRHFIEVANEAGEVIDTVKFGDVVSVAGVGLQNT